MNTITKAALLFILFYTSGCSTFELEGKGAIAPEAITGSETVHGSLYGFRWKAFNIEKCEGNTLFRTEFHTNAGLILASVLTLGLYVPQTVEWWCNSPTDDDENEQMWDPTASLGANLDPSSGANKGASTGAESITSLSLLSKAE